MKEGERDFLMHSFAHVKMAVGYFGLINYIYNGFYHVFLTVFSPREKRNFVGFLKIFCSGDRGFLEKDSCSKINLQLNLIHLNDGNASTDRICNTAFIFCVKQCQIGFIKKINSISDFTF